MSNLCLFCVFVCTANENSCCLICYMQNRILSIKILEKCLLFMMFFILTLNLHRHWQLNPNSYIHVLSLCNCGVWTAGHILGVLTGALLSRPLPPRNFKFPMTGYISQRLYSTIRLRLYYQIYGASLLRHRLPADQFSCGGFTGHPGNFDYTTFIPFKNKTIQNTTIIVFYIRTLCVIQ